MGGALVAECDHETLWKGFHARLSRLSEQLQQNKHEPEQSVVAILVSLLPTGGKTNRLLFPPTSTPEQKQKTYDGLISSWRMGRLDRPKQEYVKHVHARKKGWRGGCCDADLVGSAINCATAVLQINFVRHSRVQCIYHALAKRY
jgi:hypothetical protein